MNDSGDFFIGNKRISSNTGKEIIYDTLKFKHILVKILLMVEMLLFWY